MQFSDFYRKANKQLLEALSNNWFKGHPKEAAHFKDLLTNREPLISEPVFQTIFPWRLSEFTFAEHASRLGCLDSTFVNALDSIASDYRFPADRKPYTHQSASWKAMLDPGHRKTIVVTSGTGSGKTECFMIPVLQDLARNRGKGIQAIFLYPLNALMSDQQKRIHDWCKALDIRYAIYNGDTDENEPGKDKRDENYPRLLSREEIRRDPPQVLFTNPTLLNYMLVRDKDKPILTISKTNDSLRWILLDEAHTYTGSAASELALQLRRVIDALGSIENVHFAVTSATIGGDDPDGRLQLKRMVGRLTGKDLADIEIIDGERVVPAMSDEVLARRLATIHAETGCAIDKETIVGLRKRLNDKPLTLDEITEGILPAEATTEEQLTLVDLLADKVDDLVDPGKADALLPARAHFMLRSLNGIFTCTNPDCPDKAADAPAIGQFTTRLSTICPHPDCHAPMLEVVACASCGELLLVGNNSSTDGYSMRLNNTRLETDLFDDVDDDDDNSSPDDELLVVGKEEHPCPRGNVDRQLIRFDPVNREIRLGNGPDSFSQTMVDGRIVCPHCGKRLGYEDLRSFCAGAPYLGQILSSIVLDQAAQAEQTAGTIHYGQKYITFTDSRQATAKSAMAINQDVERTWIRTKVFQHLAEKRMNNYSPGGLSDEEQQEYEELLAYPNPGPLIQKMIRKLEEKAGGTREPAFSPEDWNSIKSALINDPGLDSVFKHIAEARRINGYYSSTGAHSKENYLNALFINQFGRSPRRANSLETLGLVKLVYPKIDARPAPVEFRRKGLEDKDWVSFLYACINYFVRENFHYIIPEGSAQYCVQDSYTDPLFGPDTTLERIPGRNVRVKKWPLLKVKRNGEPYEGQNRIVILLCAILNYNSPDQVDVDLVNSLLHKAWNDVSTYALIKTDSSDINPDNHGFKINLADTDKVKLSLIDTGWVCPVEKTIVTGCICGFSPRMKGYINAENYSRYRVAEPLTFPFFPYPDNKKTVDAHHTLEAVTEDEINAWIDENWRDKMEKGQFSDIIRDIMNIRPVFITAEHSAQLSQAIREESIKKFNAGLINILACSTTMEMGVDITGISEVVMNTVPPKPANYLQRAGRAGRRGESKAMAITFCASTPVGNESWSHPDWPMTHTTQLPAIRFESRPTVQRHVNALLFAIEVGQAGGIGVTDSCQEFFEDAGYPNFCLFLDRVSTGTGADFNATEAPFRRLVKDTILEDRTVDACAVVVKREIQRVEGIYRHQIEAIQAAMAGLPRNSSAYKVNENKLNKVRGQNLLSFLSENAFLPSAGMPIGLVEFVNDYTKSNHADNGEGFVRKKVFPTKHVSQAIAEYAPGNQVVINEWCYKSAGVGLQSPFSATNRGVLQQCSSCKFTTVSLGNPYTDCPECGGMGTMHGVLGGLFSEIVEPISFNVDANAHPVRHYKATYTGYSVPKMLNMPPWPARADGAKYVIRSSADAVGGKNPEILFSNMGTNRLGYAYCPICGRMEPMPEDDTREPLPNHLRLDGEELCASAQQGHIRKNVVLAGRYQTDFVEIKFYDGSDQEIVDDCTIYSLGVVLMRKLSEVLGINDGEIGFGLNGDYHSVFIYDTAIGGAGYSTLLREYSTQVLDAAMEDLQRCDCEKACTHCLVDRRTQWNLDLLDRHAALGWLEMEKESRTAPQEAKAIFGDHVWAITSDISTEIFAMANSGNLRRLLLCLSTDVSQWNPDGFPYLRTMNEMERNGCSVSFLLKNTLQLNALRPAQLSATLDSLMKAPFSIGTLDCGTMRPLLYAEFASGKRLIYFGERIERAFNKDWGKGKVYCAEYASTLTDQPLDRVALLTTLQSRSFVRHFSIKEKRVDSDAFLDALIRAEGSQDWNRVSDALRGKRVTLEYTDKHLNTPLAVCILAKLIDQLRTRFQLGISSLTLHLGNLVEQSGGNVDAIVKYFDDSDAQADFIHDCFNLIGIQPIIDRRRITQHERDILVSDGNRELSILPNGGISWGWRPDYASTVDFNSLDDLLDPEKKVILYNNTQDGIVYTVVLSD